MKFSLATDSHDAQLRQLAARESMPGWIRLAFPREPAWFPAQDVLGTPCQTIVMQDDAGTVVGCGLRAIRPAYVNGRECRIGYLGGLRSLPRARGSIGLARAYRCLRQFHDADRLAPAYLTTIVEDNHSAISLLTSERAGLPAYLDQGRFLTSAIPFQRRRARPAAGLEIRPGGEIPLDDILAFLNREGPRRQFFPVLTPDTFRSPCLRGFDIRGFRIALSGNRIVGVTAAWDQSAFRQTVVAGYRADIGCVRPLANAVLRLAGFPSLPPVGAPLRHFHAAFTCIQQDDPDVLAALYGQLLDENRNSGFDFFVAGFHERDPLRIALHRFHAFHYGSRLYLVRWPDGRAFCDALAADLVPHLETAML